MDSDDARRHEMNAFSPAAPSDRFTEDLIGLDRDDPEAMAFAAHLDRMERRRPDMTIEGSLSALEEFTDSANRAGGGRRLVAVVVVTLILTAFLLLVWHILVLASTVLF
ncbi:hypothetical protein TL08_20555 [Actinoalloteichus hymeniacidonis]|uniref:Uncharacterized protein n=2 Tax=Actinoalloteichus hymeniacidonis TaxID=340345 RepID=A0AAC9HSL1_9PSEU|nr:hypothetical protein TL08_20555 [Actinoalloteichus hymeniacidonis]